LKNTILLVEGKHIDHPSFTTGLVKKGYIVESVPSGAAALERLQNSDPDLAIVDASSMRSTGKRICQSLQEKKSSLPIILIVNKDADVNDKAGANVVLALPFTMQKLVNRVKQLLPLQNNSAVTVGPFQLDAEQRRVVCDGRQIQLTPRLVVLLKILMDHPGEVVEREKLFCEAWETNYTGDTRSLDVHMSWLRQAIEENPRHPKYIKTIRGVGYRLDMDTATRPIQRRHAAPAE
jgi:Response regulators consisting of a CheY-like receiver domain and a winged-helix DNA-binding domain